MSNARKLQTEIERTMKKIDEGVELFDEIWEKVYSAEQQNQKEKFEMDLKKEIKKLQRHRDQIKTWISGSEVKDKEPLIEARKLIESKMEQFKICEKETKTKTYSKEGLAREDKLDPEDEAKLNTTSWLGEYIEKFTQEVEEKDFEIEKLSSGKGKKSQKHKIEALQQYVQQHKFHISKLEGIIRLVNNDVLSVDVVDPLKDDLDYYLESYQEDDYAVSYDEEYFYESLGLDELDVVNVDRVTHVNKKADDATSTSSRSSKEKRGSKKSSTSMVIPLTIGRARSSKEKAKDEEKATPTKIGRASSTASSGSKSDSTPVPAPVKATAPTPPAPPTQPGTSMAAILKRESEQQEKERQEKLQREQQARAQAEQLRLQQQRQQQEAQLRQQEALRQQQQAQQEALQRQQQEAKLAQQQKEAAAQKQAQQAAAAAAAEKQALQNQQLQQQQAAKSQSAPSNAVEALTLGLGDLSVASSASRSTEAAKNPAPGIAAAAAAGGLETGSSYLSALNESFNVAPSTTDNERSRTYTPQNPYPTPSSYPSAPSSIFENSEVFEKLGTDALFFIFYYSQGTYQQYLAARELKKQSWRFHKKYMTWFQRHEEPKITTDEYEQGTYVYFDYETGWCTRIKTDFRFEYAYLEDSLQ